MDGWNIRYTSFLLGPGLFSGAILVTMGMYLCWIGDSDKPWKVPTAFPVSLLLFLFPGLEPSLGSINDVSQIYGC